MISRVADYCFWFGRYLDRAESSARLLQATRALVFDADIPVTHCWQPLVIVAGEEQRFVERHGKYALGNGELVMDYMTWSRENPVSLANSVRAARECARAIRDQLSLDAWEEINELYLWIGRANTRDLYQDNREEFRKRIEAEPRKYIAQHRIELSTCPTWDPKLQTFGPRRVDLRPFVLTSKTGSWVLPGGLTRVALVEGSYVVNSSQGGGSKDTWVERDPS